MSINDLARELTGKSLLSKSGIARLSAMKVLCTLVEKGQLANGYSMDSILDCLMHEDPDIRYDAAHTLGVLKSSKAVEALIQALKDPEPEVRIVAVESLGMIGTPDVVEPLLESMMAEETDVGFDDDDEFDWDPQWDVQSHAIKALGDIGDPRAIDAFLKLLNDEELPDLNELVMKSISMTKGDERAINALIEVLKDKNPILRRRAAKVLGNIDTPDVSAALMEALLDNEADVRINAATSLSKRSEQAIFISLALLLKDPVGEVRSEIAKIIAKMEHPKKIDHLLPLLDDKDPEVLGVAVEILGELKEPEALGKLIEMIKEKDQPQKGKIATAIGCFDDHKALEPLREVAVDTNIDTFTRIQALYAIGKVGGEEALAVLKGCAKSESKEVCFASMVSMQKTGTPEAIASLIEILEEEPKVIEKEGEKLEEKPETEKSEGPDEEGVPKPELEEGVPKPELKEADFADGEVVPGEGETGGGSTEELEKHESDIPMGREALRNIKNPVAEEKDMGFIRKRFAIRLLGDVSTSESVEALVNVMDKGIDKLQNEAAVSLGFLREKRAIPFLCKLLDSSDREEKLSALDGLGRIGLSNEEAFEKIRKMAFKDPDIHIRMGTVSAIGYMKNEGALEALLEILNDDAMEVRNAGVRALGELKDSKALDPLFNSLFDYERFSNNRKSLIKSLGQVDWNQTQELLISVLKDEERLEDHWVVLDAFTDYLRGGNITN